MLKIKTKEAGKVRMARFGFPQPPYDRLYSWVTGMLVMLAELEFQEYSDACQQVHSFLANCVRKGKDPIASSKKAVESPVLAPSGKWTGLCGKFEMMLDTMTPVMTAEPEIIRNMIYIFEINEISGVNEDHCIEYDFDPKQSFLAFTMKVIMDDLRAKGLYGSAVEELRIVTVPDFKPKWVPIMGLNGHAIRDPDRADRGRLSRCSVCAQPANVPYHMCRLCGESPTYHHGRCCPGVSSRNQRLDEDDPWGNMVAISSEPPNRGRGSASRSPPRAGHG